MHEGGLKAKVTACNVYDAAAANIWKLTLVSVVIAAMSKSEHGIVVIIIACILRNACTRNFFHASALRLNYILKHLE